MIWVFLGLTVVWLVLSGLSHIDRDRREFERVLEMQKKWDEIYAALLGPDLRGK